MFYECLKQGIKNRNSALNRAGKSAIFVLNRVRVLGAGPHLPIQGYIKYPPKPPPPPAGPPPSICHFVLEENLLHLLQVAIWAVTSDQKTRQVVTYKRLKTIENC